MKSDFDLKAWDEIKYELLRKYPQLTTADVIWRHGTKDDFYRTIAAELGMSKSDFEQVISEL